MSDRPTPAFPPDTTERIEKPHEALGPKVREALKACGALLLLVAGAALLIVAVLLAAAFVVLVFGWAFDG